MGSWRHLVVLQVWGVQNSCRRADYVNVVPHTHYATLPVAQLEAQPHNSGFWISFSGHQPVEFLTLTHFKVLDMTTQLEYTPVESIEGVSFIFFSHSLAWYLGEVGIMKFAVVKRTTRKKECRSVSGFTPNLLILFTAISLTCSSYLTHAFLHLSSPYFSIFWIWTLQ